MLRSRTGALLCLLSFCPRVEPSRDIKSTQFLRTWSTQVPLPEEHGRHGSFINANDTSFAAAHVTAFHANASSKARSSSNIGGASNRTGKGIAAAWIYFGEPEKDWWYSAPFSQIDILYLGPAGIQPDGSFGIHRLLEDRFLSVTARARAANPAIKIVVSQWWGSFTPGGHEWGKTLREHFADGWYAKLKKADIASSYARSVAEFVQRQELQGFDIDYEQGNLLETFPALAKEVRHELDAVRAGLLFTISPAKKDHLTPESLRYVDYVNMQSYAGGLSTTLEDYEALGVPMHSILYGICPESNCWGPSAEEACETIHERGLAGVHTWRLNSPSNYQEEIDVFVDMRRRIRLGDC